MLKVAVCQMDIAWHDTSRNLLRAEQMIAEAEADLAVLPEMFATGFDPDSDGVVEPAESSESIAAVRRWAKEYGKAIIAGVAVSENGNRYNRMIMATPEGTLDHYDKRHTFSIGGESLRFNRGHERKVFTYKGVRLLAEICYDLRFPVWSRYADDYDAIVYAASWPASRQRVFDTLLRARAIENSCYTIGVNRVGHDRYCVYSGGSAVIDFKGNAIAETRPNEQHTVTADLDLDSLRVFRTGFPVALDADHFKIEI